MADDVPTSTSIPAPPMAPVLDGYVTGAAGAPADTLDRIYPVFTVSWDTSHYVNYNWSVDFPDVLFAQQFIKDKIANYSYFKAEVEFTVRLNGNKFNYGALLLSWDPATSLDTNPAPYSTYNLVTSSGYPHLLIQASDAETASMTVPFVYPQTALVPRLQGGAEIGSLDITVLVPLTSISSVVSPAVEVTVYAHFKNIVLDGPTEATGVTLHSAGQKTRRIAAASAEAADKTVSDTLDDAIHATAEVAESVVSKGLGAIKGLFGSLLDFDLPSSLAPIHRFVPRTCPDMMHTSGLDEGLVMARRPARKPTLLPGLSSLPPQCDEMDLATAASVPGIIDFNNTFTSATAKGAVIGSWPVNPRYCYSDWDTTAPITGCQRYYPTPAALVSLPFAYWRGTMRYMIYFICSSFHAARVKISFVPRMNALGSPSAPVNSMSAVVDINGPTTFKFSVPFLWHQPFAQQSIGAVVVTMVNPPPTVGDVANPPVYMVVYAAMGEDAVFQDMSAFRFIPTDYITVGQPESAPREEFLQAFQPLAPGCVSTPVTDAFFPDSFTKVSDVTRMWQQWPSVSSTPSAAYPAASGTTFALLPQAPHANVFSYQRQAVDMQLPTQGVLSPFMEAVFQLNVNVGLCDTILQTLDSTTPGFPQWTIADHFAQLYRFQRGGARLRWYGLSTGKSVLAVPCADMLGGFGISSTTAGLTITDVTPCGSLPVDIVKADCNPFQLEIAPSQTVSTDTVVGLGITKLEVDVPWRGVHPFCSTSQPASYSDSGGLGYYPAAVEMGRNILVTRENARVCGDTDAIEPTGQYFRAMSDDHRFYFIRGPRPCCVLMEPTFLTTEGQHLIGATAADPGPNNDYMTRLWNSVYLSSSYTS